MIAVTAMCAAVVTEASAQPTLVLNEQLNGLDVLPGQTLNVVDAEDQVTATTVGDGNRLSVAVYDVSAEVQSNQDARGHTRVDTTLNLSGEAGPVSLYSRAGANRLEAGVYGGDMAMDATQVSGQVDVIASSTVAGAPGRMLGGGAIDASAAANTAALAISGGVLSGSIEQSAESFTQANVLGNPQYIPAPAAFTAQASGNVVAATGAASDMNLDIRQRQNGAQVVATSSGNAGNGWDLASRAAANGNQIALYNQGGSLVATTDQANSAEIRSTAIATAYDFGAVTSHARAGGNVVEVGNNDIHLQIDNSQLNTGGVEAVASFAGTNGYDAYVGADATGNSITAYACADCSAYMGITNTQVNNANVTASATTVINGAGRAVVSGVNATGNSATFYVTRDGGQ
jgi:hypothetical protein